MKSEIIITMISSGFALGVIKLILPTIKSFIKERADAIKKRHTYQSFQNEELIIEHLIYLGQKYDFTYSLLCKAHNGGKEMHELSTKNLTIIKEYPTSSTVKRLKPLWQAREIDRFFVKILMFLLVDGKYHVEDMEGEFEPNKGLRKVFNKFNGREVFLVDLGFINDDYHFMMFQREEKMHDSERSTLTERSREEIEYRCGKVWKLCKHARNL